MTEIAVSMNIHDHGSAMDPQKKKIKCNYCGKVVSGSTRLKFHLGGVRGDVIPCEMVPTNVKEVFLNELNNKKKGNLRNEVGALHHPNLPWKRNVYSETNGIKNGKEGISQTAGPGSSDSKKRIKIDSSSEDSEIGSVSYPKRQIGPQAANKNINNNIGNSSLRQAQKCIARFFYENGIDFAASRSPSFQKMISATLGCGQHACKIPSSQEFNGWIFQDELQDMHHYVKTIRNSWESTGCSILLDGWIDDKGRNLINIVADCPQGAIYLCSYDISAFMGDVHSMVLFFEGILLDVGIENVVQIITYFTSAFMEAVGRQLTEKHRRVFWTVSASYCIEMMLEKFSRMDVIRGTLEEAKIITNFIDNNASVLNLLRSYARGYIPVNPSKSEKVLPYLALENIVSVKERLKEMFTSSDWNNSAWASTNDGERVATLLTNRLFWSGAMTVLNAAIPLVRVLDLINESNMPQLGVIYETIDQAKETIKEEFNNKKSQYMPFWNAIDEIWNRKLHSPLHSAGYFLNPTLFYSSDFFTDAEVASDLLSCIVRMTQDERTQDAVSLQVEDYRGGKGAFGQGSGIKHRSELSPVQWWTKFGEQCPELQKLAIRILSQTCNGASKFKLKRSLAEKLLMKGKSQAEQKRLSDLGFVHYNLHLKNFVPGASNDVETGVANDLMVYEAEEVFTPQNGETSRRELDHEATWGAAISGERILSPPENGTQIS